MFYALDGKLICNHNVVLRAVAGLPGVQYEMLITAASMELWHILPAYIVPMWHDL